MFAEDPARLDRNLIIQQLLCHELFHQKQMKRTRSLFQNKIHGCTCIVDKKLVAVCGVRIFVKGNLRQSICTASLPLPAHYFCGL